MPAVEVTVVNHVDILFLDGFTAPHGDQAFDLFQVEAPCKHVMGTRMTRGGMRWSRRGAEATLYLRTTWLNGGWDDLWALPLQAA